MRAHRRKKDAQQASMDAWPRMAEAAAALIAAVRRTRVLRRILRLSSQAASRSLYQSPTHQRRRQGRAPTGGFCAEQMPGRWQDAAQAATIAEQRAALPMELRKLVQCRSICLDPRERQQEQTLRLGRCWDGQR